MKIIFIRHGDPDYEHDSLTKKGWREAALLADAIEKMPVTDFYCSPLGRARDTAGVTLRRIGREAEIQDWMQEFIYLIDDPETGKKRIPWDFMPSYWTKEPQLYDKDNWMKHPIMQTGEVEAAYARVCDGLDGILARYGYIRVGGMYHTQAGSTATIVLFCHLGITLVMMGHLLGISPIPLLQGFFGAPTSITTLVTEERIKGEVEFRCTSFASTAHLAVGNEPFSRSGLFEEVQE